VELRSGDLQPVQVVLASGEGRTYGLVVLGRPGGAQRGMVFPASRWVTFEGRRVTVRPGPAVEPDPVLAVTRLGVVVLSAGPDNAPRRVDRTVLDPSGAVRVPRTAVPGTQGLAVDSPLVPWREGLAVVLGRPTDAESDTRTELLHLLTGDGRPLRTPVTLTTETRDDTQGLYRAGLCPSADGVSLTALWTIRGGPRAGVWASRGITGTTTPAPVRVGRPPQGAFGPEATPWGFVYRHPTEGDGSLTEFLAQPWSEAGVGAPRSLGRYWDPVLSWGERGAVLLGQGSGARVGEVEARLSHTAGPRATVRPVTLPASALDALGDAVDVALSATRDGAVAAWITPGDETGSAPRTLAVARVACR
jgi:hypothetical protein